MSYILLTIDTEYAFGIAAKKGLQTQAENFARSISCETTDGSFGVGWQARMLREYGLSGVFFVDPMPALIWGVGAIADIVAPILAYGHDIQLHLHTEWLSLLGDDGPIGGRTGSLLRDFSYDDQRALIALGRDLLVDAGASAPIAFRAGNYAANDDTLRALAALGFAYDSSHCPGLANSECEISLGQDDRAPLEHCGVTEVPTGCLADFQGLRHAQITALSLSELKAAIRFARDQEIAHFTLVSHSFELLNRKRTKANKIVCRRFEALCAFLAAEPGISTGTYRDTPPVPAATSKQPLLAASPMRTGLRYAEQVVSNLLYGGDWKPETETGAHGA